VAISQTKVAVANIVQLLSFKRALVAVTAVTFVTVFKTIFFFGCILKPFAFAFAENVVATAYQ
jgi:hypothetical protein